MLLFKVLFVVFNYLYCITYIAVIVGDSPGSKETKARELNIPIWDENYLKDIFVELGVLND